MLQSVFRNCWFYGILEFLALSSTTYSHPPYRNPSEKNAFAYSESDVPFKTSWPLQNNYPGSYLTNLNLYLSLFSDCLINIQNFQGIDFQEPSYPIHLTRFDIAGVGIKFHPNRSDGYPDTLRFPFGKVPPLNQLGRYLFSTPKPIKLTTYTDSIKFRWNCFAQFDLFYPEIKDAYHFFLHSFQHPEKYTLGPNSLWVSSSEVEEEPYSKFVFGDNTRPTYFILMMHRNSSKATKDFWGYQKLMNSFVNRHTALIFHLTTGNFETSQSPVFQLNPIELSVESLSFVCFTCCACKQVIVPLQLNSWKDEVFQLISLRGRIPWKIRFNTVASEIFKSTEYPSFRAFLLSPKTKRYLADKAMTQYYVMPNTTFLTDTYISREQECLEFSHFIIEDTYEYSSHSPGGRPICHQPEIYFDLKGQGRALTRGRDSYTFISCGVAQWQKTSISGLFSSFDRPTWGCILTFVILWPVILSLIENNFDFRLVLINSQTWLLGIILLLEQGHYLVENRNKRGPLYYTCGLTILVLIVVSNAYKGDNIQSLSKSFEQIPYTLISQIIDHGFRIYSPCILNDVAKFRLTAAGFEECTLEFEDESISYAFQVSEAKLESMRLAVEHHPDAFEIFFEDSDIARYTDIIGKCDQVAIVGWKRDLQVYYDNLKNKSSTKGLLFLGTEDLFTSQLGWDIDFWRDPTLPQRIAYLKDTGIPEEWIKIGQRVYLPPPVLPIRLNMNGNVIVQFYCLLLGLMLSLLAFVLEKYITFRRVSKSWLGISNSVLLVFKGIFQSFVFYFKIL